MEHILLRDEEGCIRDSVEMLATHLAAARLGDELMDAGGRDV